MLYDAIVLDTQTIDNYHWRFNEGMLARMKQFYNNDAQFIMPDIIRNEVLSHLSKRIKETQDALDKALKDANSELLLTPQEVAFTIERARNATAESFAKSRLESFLVSCDAIEINCGDYVGVNEIFSAYFELKVPFKDVKKRKEEFPDAAVLLALENYAKTNQLEMVLVSRDGGWIDFCKQSDYLICVQDLGEALTNFQLGTEPLAFAQQLMQDIQTTKAAPLLSAIEKAIIARYDGIDFSPEADSYLSFDYETGGCHVTNVEFENIVHVLEVDNDRVTFEIKATVTYSAECEFSFYHYDSIDKDNIYLAGTAEEAEAEEETSIIFSIDGELDFDYDNISIEDVELTSVIEYVDFGEIQPHFEPDYD